MPSPRGTPRVVPASALDRLAAAVLAMATTASPAGPATGGRGGSRDDAHADRVAALVTLAQKGDAEAFGVLYEMHADLVYRYIFQRVASQSLAEDLTQETFLRALRRLDTFTWQGKDVAAWFVTIARNLVLDLRQVRPASGWR